MLSQIPSARLNGHGSYAFLKDVLTCLPTQQANDIAELLPQNINGRLINIRRSGR